MMDPNIIPSQQHVDACLKGNAILTADLPHSELMLLFDNMISPFSYYRMIYDEQGSPADYVFLAVNSAFERETGKDRQQVLGKRVLEVFPETEDYWIQTLGRVAQTGVPNSIVNYSSALHSWYEVRAYSPKRDHFAMTVVNVTAAIEDHQRLMESVKRHEDAQKCLGFEHELVKATLMSIGDGLIYTDGGGLITMANEAAKAITGWQGDSMIGRPFDSVISLLGEQSRENLPSPLNRLKAAEKAAQQQDGAIFINREAREFHISYSIARIMSQGVAGGTVFVFRDETLNRHRQAEMEFLGFHDPLTGLYNRRFFELELMRAATDMVLPVTVIVCDLNGLKFANDAFGHDSGDILLTRFADILRENCRKNDVICRCGGDEFTVVMPDMAYADAGNLVARIRQAISQVTFNKGILSVAFGWETMTQKSQNFYHILKKAEDHMYRNKLLEATSIRSHAIQIVLDTLCDKSVTEANHSRRVGKICRLLGERMGLCADEVSLLEMAGRMHDIGKIILVEGILEKPGPLTWEEWDEVRRHPEIGYRILVSSNEFAAIAAPILEHHERWDGNGYPKGIGGEEIQFLARIISVVDAFDAMTVNKPYRAAISREEAAAEIRRNAGKQFAPEVAKAFAWLDINSL